VNALVDYAIAHGVNYFDTAPVYVRGKSETSMGIALSRHPREKFFIATKLSNQRDDRQLRSREGSIALYRKSFVDLQVDYIDYYLLHSVGSGGGFDVFKERFVDNGMIDFLRKEKAAGRIRNLGWSYHGDIAAVDYLLAMDIQWDFAMIQLNYVDWRNATRDMVSSEYLYTELEKHKIPTIVMEPLLGGRLSRLPAHSLAQLKQMRPDDNPAAWAFRYAGSPNNVLTVLSGMTYMEHLQENIRTYSPLEPLAEPEYKALEQVTELMLHSDFIPCTTCQYCMPCPYGIDIPSIFTHYNRCVNDDLLPKDAQDENYRKARRAFLVGYDRSVPKLRQASHCINCDKCVPKCPQKIKISQEMARIDKFAEQLKRKG
jgi:predicted aldo/keto reductase-like oxidoreductase